MGWSIWARPDCCSAASAAGGECATEGTGRSASALRSFLFSAESAVADQPPPAGERGTQGPLPEKGRRAYHLSHETASVSR